MAKTCKISKGTKLKELAEFFKLTPEQLKRYHNIYCPIEDLIEQEIPSHVRIVYVPPEGDELVASMMEPVKRDPISYKAKNTLSNIRNYQRVYGVIYTISENEVEKLKIHYKTSVKKEKDIITITREEVYINNKRPDLVVEQMADKLSGVLYPLVLAINPDGTIKAIVNHKEIQERWRELKPKLNEYYQGEEAKGLFQRVNNIVKNKDQMLNILRGDLFFSLFFIPLYQNFDDTQKCNTEIELSIEGVIELFDVIFSLSREISPTEKFIVKAEGTQQLIYPPVDDQNRRKCAKLDFLYKLNLVDNSIFLIMGDITTVNKKVKFECYQQRS